MLRLSAGVLSNLFTAFHLTKNRLDVFYILAFVPLPVIAYYDISYLSPLMFGFLLLLLKRSKLFVCRGAIHTQRAVGVVVTLSSFITFCLPVYFSSSLVFYGASYSAYIFGLFLAFFDLPSLKEAFTPIFIVLAATSISFISNGLEPSLSPHIIPIFTSLVVAISNALGVRATTQYPDLIIINTRTGTLPLQIIWGCVGVYGVLVFSTLMIVVLWEELGSLKTKTLWAVAGLIGVLVLNIIRVVIIVVADYYYSAEVAAQFHLVLGYALFLPWLAFFLYTFSRRESILQKIVSIKQRLR